MTSKKNFKIIAKSKTKKSSNKDYVKTIERLLTILSVLDKGGSVSTSELAEKMNVTRRTSQRDISLLERCGYPIYEKIRGRYAFVQGFSLRKVELSSEQASMMSFMFDIAESMGGKFENSFQELFKRLMAQNLDTPYYAKMPVAAVALPNTKTVQTLEEAIEGNQRIEVLYVSGPKGERQYVVEPLKMALFDGFWYCIVQDKTDRRLLKLRIDRIVKVGLLDEQFTAKIDIDKMLDQSVNVWFDGVREDRVLIRVSSSIADFFKKKAYFPLQKIIAVHKDGTLDLETYPAHPEEIKHTILHWLPGLTVLEPASFKDEIKRTVATYLKSL